MERRKILFILGTRPEAIKLCPLIRYLRLHAEEFDTRVCVTGQHRELLNQVLDVFDVRPDHDLHVMTSGQTLFQSTSRILQSLEPVLSTEKPGMVIVQGDTTTTFCGALAAFYTKSPVGHVEAGLRTNDLYQPFPEEVNRVLTSRLATLHFAVTERAARNLLTEGITELVSVTGNSGIDAVLYVSELLGKEAIRAPKEIPIAVGKRLILVTAHRRESFGSGFYQLCRGLRRIADRPDVQLIYPVHPNPNVREVVYRELASVSNIDLIDALDYISFVNLMRKSHILLTDSGGVQEEGPSLGKPVLVMREKTERPEAVEAGTAVLVGTSEESIVLEVNKLLDDADEYERRSRIHNPYGDGHASVRITASIRDYFRSTQ